MKLGTLLAAGKSLALRRRGQSPYRTDKQIYLPKFGSPKTPFASANQSGGAIPPEEVAAAPVKTPITVVAAKTQKLPTFSPAPRAASPQSATSKRPARLRVKSGQPMKWLSRLNPFVSASAFSAARSGNVNPPVQAELSLDSVKVLRNDLSDVDIEVVPLKSRPAAGGETARRGLERKTWGPFGVWLMKMKTG